MSKIEHPYYPIIYIRGYAMTQSAVEDTVADPYMGFNLGSTKLRQLVRAKSFRWTPSILAVFTPSRLSTRTLVRAR